MTFKHDTLHFTDLLDSQPALRRQALDALSADLSARGVSRAGQRARSAWLAMSWLFNDLIRFAPGYGGPGYLSAAEAADYVAGLSATERAAWLRSREAWRADNADLAAVIDAAPKGWRRAQLPPEANVIFFE